MRKRICVKHAISYSHECPQCRAVVDLQAAKEKMVSDLRAAQKIRACIVRLDILTKDVGPELQFLREHFEGLKERLEGVAKLLESGHE